MPKRAQHVLAWSNERDCYEWRDGEQPPAAFEPTSWRTWLDEHTSFAFVRHEVRFNLLKEQRKAGPGYWYAYRRHGKHIVKRYAGRTAELTLAHLERLAQQFTLNEQPTVVPQPTNELNGVPQAEPLLAPKLQLPRLQTVLVRRERLLHMLEANRKLALLSAPAGFGKTTLVRQWLAQAATQDHAPNVAWIGLDAGDNDPLRFWRYLITAAQAFGAEIGARSLALLEIAIKSPLDLILMAFVNELAQIRHDSLLVLEDYHVIAAPQIHEAIGLLLEHLPRHVRLVIITRTRPPLPLARLAANGELTEIEAPELRFSLAETSIFLKQSSPLLFASGDLAAIESRVEGWPAGLRLLALALEGRDDPADAGAILANFVAGRRGVGEYFITEVLNKQPAAVQHFLLQTSFLTRMTASLCDYVTETVDSQLVLEELEQANLFIEPLDGVGQWYRYHNLFAAVLQAEARRRFGDVVQLLERAGQWYEAQALYPEAIRVALLAGNVYRAADLIEQVIAPQFSLTALEMHGPPEFHTIQNWLSQLPAQVLDERPFLHLALASATLFSAMIAMHRDVGNTDNQIEQLLTKAEHGFRKVGDNSRLGQIFAFRSLLFRERGEIATAVMWAELALEALPPQELSWRSVCLGMLGLGEQHTGALVAANLLFAKAQAKCEQLGNRPFARASGVMRAFVLLEQNQLHQATSLFQQMLAEARIAGDFDDIANASYGLAEIAMRWNDLDSAWTYAEEAVAIKESYPHEPDFVMSVLVLAHIEQARGHNNAALARCAALLSQQAAMLVPREKQLARQIAFEQAQIALIAGDLAAAQHWRATRSIDLSMSRLLRDRESMFLARILMHEGDAAVAVEQLERLIASAEADGCEQIALEARVLLAVVLVTSKHVDRARQVLIAALESAQPANAQRIFIVEGEALANLLRAIIPLFVKQHLLVFTRTLLRAMSGEQLINTSLLSPQEQRVLRLLARGNTNPQIAADLIVSVNTVKAHIKSIYRKLNANNRLEAVAAARNNGLL